MLADAISSEAFKLAKNTAVWFWGFVFPAVVALVLSLAGALFLDGRMPAGVMPINLAAQLLKALADAGSPLTQLLVLVPAASLFGGEYRWETWRLLTPRAGRLNLLGSKIIVFAAGAAAAILVLGLAGLIGALFQGLLNHSPLLWEPGPAFAAHLAGQFAVSWAQLLVVGSVSALVAVISRSNVAALIVPILVGVAQSILGGLARMDPEHLLPLRLLGLPGLASDILHNGIEGNLAPIDGEALLQASAVTLALWIVAGFALALAYFWRQDLSKE